MFNDLINILKRVGAEEGAPAPATPESSSLLQTALESYQHTIESIGEHVADVPRGIRDGVRKRMKSVRHQLKMTPDRTTIEATRKQVDAELRQIGKQVEEQRGAQDSEVKQIMGIVATLADSVASREQSYQVRFRGIAKKLRLLTTSENLATIRKQLADEVGQLERYCEDMSRDTAAAVERMRSDLTTRERRPAGAAPGASSSGGTSSLGAPSSGGPSSGGPPSTFAGPIVDPATGLHSRGEGIGAMQDLLRSGSYYCVLVLSIGNGKVLAQRYPERMQEQLANAFGLRIRAHFQDAVILCRDSQWDFLALMPGKLPDAAAKAHDLELRLSGAYKVRSESGAEEQVSLDCYTGAVQPLMGEAMKDVLQRLHPEPVR